MEDDKSQDAQNLEEEQNQNPKNQDCPRSATVPKPKKLTFFPSASTPIYNLSRSDKNTKSSPILKLTEDTTNFKEDAQRLLASLTVSEDELKLSINENNFPYKSLLMQGILDECNEDNISKPIMLSPKHSDQVCSYVKHQFSDSLPISTSASAPLGFTLNFSDIEQSVSENDIASVCEINEKLPISSIFDEQLFSIEGIQLPPQPKKSKTSRQIRKEQREQKIKEITKHIQELFAEQSDNEIEEEEKELMVQTKKDGILKRFKSTMKKQLNRIISNLSKDPTTFDEKYLIVMKNSFKQYCKNVIFNHFQKRMSQNTPQEIYEQYSKHLMSLKSFIKECKSEIDQYYTDKKKPPLLNRTEGIVPNSTLYVVSETDKSKETEIEIDSYEDLYSKIPQDY